MPKRSFFTVRDKPLAMQSGHTYFFFISFRPIKENENVDHAQDCANPRSQKPKTQTENTDRISAVFKKVRIVFVIKFT